jgi:hypothetical protein
MMPIVFVDDEVNVLQAMQRALHGMKHGLPKPRIEHC